MVDVRTLARIVGGGKGNSIKDSSLTPKVRLGFCLDALQDRKAIGGEGARCLGLACEHILHGLTEA